MKNFIDTILDFDGFDTAFTVLYYKIRKEVNTFKIDLKQIEKFQPSTRSDRFASSMSSIYRQFEEVEDKYCTEQEVKEFVKKTYLKII